MASMEELRAGVRASLPEVDEIQDATLRDKVIAAWALSLSQSEFTRIEQIRASGNPTSPPLKNGTQANHLRGVARMAVALADALRASAWRHRHRPRPAVGLRPLPRCGQAV